VTIAIWVGLFAATAFVDWLSARWVDARTRTRRANISAIHEATSLVAGFTVFALYQDPWMIVPCVAGAWAGSWLAGVKR
jgi:hypothetical protein